MGTTVTLDEYSRLVSAIHAAAMTPDHWCDVMQSIQESMGATGGGMIVGGGADRSIEYACVPPGAGEQYSEYYHRFDYVLDAVERGPVGVIHTGGALVALEAHSEFNHDWMRPHHMDDGIFVRLTDGSRPTCFLVAAPRRDESYADDARLELFEALVPHMQQALRTQEHVDDLEHAARDVAGAVDGMRHAVIVVGPDTRVVHLNAVAEAMQARHEGPYVHYGRLRARSASTDDELQKSIRGALGVASPASYGSSVVHQRVSSPRPLILHVVPFTSQTRDGEHARALVVVVDPDCQPEPTADLLRRAFGLTKAEADVALLVAQGDGLRPIADELSLSMATVKTHLQHVFDKTDTHRQAELVRLLLAVNP
jgi:DNA-binding CsgD family transcriptional regulator/PAS domain-containing protein